MTTAINTNIAIKNAFEQTVYAQFPTHLHEHVEHELFYHGSELEQGKMTMQEFAEGVTNTEHEQNEEEAQQTKNNTMFEGIKVLIDEGKFKDTSFAAELTRELELGEDSLLARFISLQPVTSSLDAALSFLAWKYTKALVDLEAAFDVNLDHFRSTTEPEFYCTSESNMSLVNFSVMSK